MACDRVAVVSFSIVLSQTCASAADLGHSTLPIPQPRYPVRTAGILPGKQDSRSGLPNSIPIFLIGSDPLSREWLTRRRDELSKLGAFGILVQAESESDLQEMAALAPNLPIAPLDLSQMVKLLGIAHYPALISSGRIEQ